ncbi:hypothetical protein [Mycobacterium sp. DL99]|uniref:hypothetical protein n=1 Tax=Mycobacterium sp. DL99 TaxID=2528957 RepID=UPI001081FD6E|nr:hypothetical protein [Mycobacterium sp. DL99]
MTDVDPELAATLDAEYRELVRSLHQETISIISDFEQWWIGGDSKLPGCFAATVTKGGGFELSAKDQRTADRAEERWRNYVHPRMSILINGHPDPDVREAADVLDKRSFFPIVLFHRPDGERSEERKEENHLAVKLIHDGLSDLRRAAYRAPFRVHRPEPDWDGVPTGNREGLPGTILKQMKERGENWRG